MHHLLYPPALHDPGTKSLQLIRRPPELPPKSRLSSFHTYHLHHATLVFSRSFTCSSILPATSQSRQLLGVVGCRFVDGWQSGCRHIMHLSDLDAETGGGEEKDPRWGRSPVFPASNSAEKKVESVLKMQTWFSTLTRTNCVFRVASMGWSNSALEQHCLKHAHLSCVAM